MDNKRKFLFYIAKLYSVPIIIPLVKYLDTIGADYAFYVSQIVEENFPVEWGKKKILHSIKETVQFAPDFVLCPGNFVDFRIPGIKVQIFHGLGIEKPSHYKIRHFFDVYLTSGPYVTKRFLELQKKHKYFKVKETGWPKVDYIINYDHDGIREKLSLPKYKKIILYAPTFSNTMESASELLPVIPGIIKDDELWLMKFHELMDKNLIDRVKATNSENIRIVPPGDITPYLHAADIMISDTSSVIYEFLLLEKPVITYKTLGNVHKGVDIDDPSRLRDTVDNIRSYFNMEKSRQALNEVNPYRDGKIAERIVHALDDLSVIDLPEHRKPLNLYRKMQIIYHSVFRKGYLR